MPQQFARLAGDAALIGAFQGLINSFRGDEVWAVGSPLDYGRFLEDGTSRMPPYPWLQPAVDETYRKGALFARRASNPQEIQRLAAQDVKENAERRLWSRSARPYPRTGRLASSVEVRRI